VIKKLILIFLCLDFALLLSVYISEAYARAHPVKSSGEAITINLQRGPFTVFEFPAKKTPPLAVIIFGSGDGGWSSWEETVSHALQARGYTVIGIDSADYAKTDYDLATLQADFDKIARTFADPSGASSPPLIVGGWSMGAAQAIAVAGGPNPPGNLVGVLAVSPLSRGRYGLRVSDQLNILPTGPGTFAVGDFASGMDGLRIGQWHAAEDRIDSRAWLSGLKAAHREYDFPDAGHDYADANQAFLRQLVESVAWILNPSSSPQ